MFDEGFWYQKIGHGTGSVSVADDVLYVLYRTVCSMIGDVTLNIYVLEIFCLPSWWATFKAGGMSVAIVLEFNGLNFGDPNICCRIRKIRRVS